MNYITPKTKFKDEMKIIDKKDLRETAVVFKSLPEFYDLEESGLKPNTVRCKSVNDPRIRLLLSMRLSGAYGQVIIVNNEDKQLRFTRRIKSIACFKKDIIISWWPTLKNIIGDIKKLRV